MKAFLSFFRVKEWYDSKIPFAMAAYLYLCCYESAAYSLAVYGAYFLFFVAYFAFNYLFNDFCDMESDKKAGKIKPVHSVGRPVVSGVLVALALAGNLPLWVVTGMKFSCVAMSVLVYLLGMSYSSRWTRLKEKGIWGVVVSSFAQRNSPILMLLTITDIPAGTFFCWMILVFVNGLRYILIHQYLDRENDSAAGTHTFVRDRNISIRKAVIASLVTESVCCLWLFRTEMGRGLFWVLVLCYLVICVLNRIFAEKIARQSFLYSFVCVPYEDLFNLYIPFLLTLKLALGQQAWLLLVLTALYLAAPFVRRMGMLAIAVIKTARGELGEEKQ